MISVFALSITPHLALDILLWVSLALVLSGLAMWPLSYLVASKCVYDATLRRKKKDKWSREPEDLEGNSLKMYAEGKAWQKTVADAKRDVHIVNDGLNLYGEYYDLGYDRCVIILSGRTESLTYGYYFAQPYAKAGWNILVLDPRAHGMSDGEFNTVGFEESRDALAWARHIHDEFGVASIVFHGICIGGAGGIFAMTHDDCPDYIDGIVIDGTFTNFGESMKNHLIERKKPIFILYDLINMWMKHYTGHSMDYGPIDVIEKMSKPMLMLYSREDLYSLPEYSQRLFERAGSEKKRLVWFEHGAHSMLRVTDPERYDTAITEFLSENFALICANENKQ